MEGGGLGLVWIVVPALAAALLGFGATWRITRNGRAPASVEQALLWWDEGQASTFREDPIAASLMAVHTAAIVGMGVMSVLLGARALQHLPDWLPGPGVPIWLIYHAGLALNAGVAWVIAGSTLALPLARRHWSPVRVAVTEDGVYRGRAFLPWAMIGRVRRNGPGGLMRLYSRKTPGLVLLALRPPAAESLESAHRLVEARVPPLTEDYRIPWYRHMPVFGFLLVMTALPIVVVGLVAYPSTATWAWASQGLGAWLAAMLAAQVIRAYQ